jgi:hypothetical protein
MRRGSPYGTDICPLEWPSLYVWVQWDCPSLFLWQREGFQEHAVALRPPIALWAGSWKVAVYTIEEIGDGQQ